MCDLLPSDQMEPNIVEQGVPQPQLRGELPTSSHQRQAISRGAPIGRRSIHCSQIPVRAPTSSSNSRPRTVDDFNLRPTQNVHAVAVSMAKNQGLVQSIEKAFNVYGERIRADLRDFRGLCTNLVVQEQMEADKWHSLCMKIMKERDYARQQLHILSQERRTQSPPTSPVMTNEGSSATALKRGIEDVDPAPMDDTVRNTSSSPVDVRPMRGIRLSPVHSPACSSARLSASPPPPFSHSISPSPPSSADIVDGENSAAGSSDGPPVKRRKSVESDRSVSSERTLVDPTAQVDRRTLQNSNGVHVKQQSRTPSPLSFPTKPPAFVPPPGKTLGVRSLPGEFTHVDLMYVPMKGSLVCRACL